MFFFFGRRCPGLHIADATLFIALVHLLATFNIVPVLNAKGDVMPMEEEWVSNGPLWYVNMASKITDANCFFSLPKRFPCRFVPRTERVDDLLEQYD
jgi:hypothetical protein